MSRNNPLRNSTRKNTNYKLYKAKKQWVTACATFLLTFGATAVVTTANAQADTNSNDNQPQVTGVESTTTGTNSQKSTSLASVKNEEEQGSSAATDTATSSSDAENTSTATNESASSDTSATKTTGELTSNDKTVNSTTTQASTVKDVNNNKEETPVQNNNSSDSSAAKTNDESASNDSTAKSTAAQASVAKDADTDNGAVDADSESKSSETTTVDLTKVNGDALDPAALKDSKAKTTDSTVNWSQNRYIYNWDQQGHTADWWKNLISQKFLPWILKQSDNEGATLDSVSWTSGMTTNSNGTLQPTMIEGPADNRFGYPHATVVVTNANGTKTTYTDVTINMAKSVASYIRAKWGIASNGALSDSQSATTVNITTHAGATGNLGATSVTKIYPYNWSYTGEYMQSLISSVDLASGTTLTTDTKNANVTLKFTDGSSIKAPNASVTVLGGQAQTGLTVAKGGNFAFAHPNATSGITSTSQSQISQWTPTYDWVYDANGTPLDASHQYNTNANFNAYVKITYHKNDQADGTQIVKVPVNVNEHTLAQQYGNEIYSHIDYITSHPISAALTDDSNSSAWSADVDADGNKNLNQYTWGIDPYQIVWKAGTNDAQKAQYKQVISSFITTTEHSFPYGGKTGTFDQGYIVGPGVTLFFTDGSHADGSVNAHIYRPSQTPGQTTFKAGDLSQFDSASASTHVTNVLPSNDSSFDVTYQWVMKDPNGSYTFNNAVNMSNTNQWVTKTNNQWGVANPNNATGTQGVTITGYRKLTENDINTVGKKTLYVLVGYTKNGKSGSTNGTYDGYYVVPQEVTITLKDQIDIKVSDNGTQTETYKDSAYNTSDLNLDNFKPSFTETSDSNSPITNLTPTTGNELTADDYTFEQNGTAINPTNAGSYDVFLKQSGINKIKNWTHASNYNFSTTGPVKVGTFKIEKAKPTVTFNGKGSKTYDGSPISNYTTPIGLIIDNTPGTTNPSISLTAGTDYVWKKGNTTYTTAPSGAGNYTIELTDVGKAKITGSNINSDNLDWKNATIKTNTSYVINQAINAKIEQNGSTSKTYDGKAASVALSTLTDSSNWSVSGLINNTDSLDFNKLTVDDFDWYLGTTDLGKLSATNIDRINKGTVGNYTIKLNSAGITALQSANPNYAISNTNVSGGYSYDITQAEATATLSGSNSRKYNGSAVTTTDLNNGGNITVTISIPNSTKTIAYTLQDGDYTWQTTDNVAPTDASTTPYTLKLNIDNILAHLQSTISGDSTWKDNVKIAATDLKGSASFTINNATATAKNMTGSYTITYGDIPDFSKASEAYTVHLTTDPTTITGFDSYKLTNGSQLQFRKHGTTDGWSTTVPTAAGTYDVILSSQGWTDLKAANSNVQVNGTGSTNLTTTATFTINSKVTFEFVDDDNKDAQGKPTVVGTPQSQGMPIGTETAISPALKIPDNYQLASGQTLPTSFTVKTTDSNTNDPVVQIHLVHKQITVEPSDPKSPSDPIPDNPDKNYPSGVGQDDLNKTVTRTITVKEPGQADHTITQKTTFKRSAVVDAVTGKIVKYNDWKMDGANGWTEYSAPAVAGYTPSQSTVAAKTVTAETADENVTITYTAVPQPGQQVIQYIDTDEDNKVVGTQAVRGEEGSMVNFTANIPINYEVVGTLPTSVIINGGTTRILLKHKTSPVTDSKTITRKIIEHLPSGDQSQTQIVTLNFTGKKDLVTNEVTGSWTTGHFDTINVTIPFGYIASQTVVPEMTVNGDTKDSTVEITYTQIAQPTTGKQIIQYVDRDGNIISFSEISGNDGEVVDFTPEAPANWQLVGLLNKDGSIDPSLPSSITIQGGTTKIVIDHWKTAVDDTLEITRTLVIHLPSGQIIKLPQVAEVTRIVTTDHVTGEKTYGDWINGKWDQYVPDPIDGYYTDPAVVPEEIVTNTTKEATVDIYYLLSSTPVSDKKVITETIHYRYADGSKAAPDKVVYITYTRSGSKYSDGTVSWDPWAPAGSQSFAAVASPEISGYTPDQQTIPEQTVIVDSNNLEFTVTYNLNSQPDNPDNPDQPVNPDNPDQPDNPDNPSQPVNPDNPNTPDQPNNPDQPATPGKPVGPTFPGKPGTPVQPGNGFGQENSTGTTNQQAKRLPQTGDGHNEAITTAGLLLASLSGLFGLGGLKKKRDER